MLFFGAGAVLGGWVFDRFVGKREDWRTLQCDGFETDLSGRRLQAGGVIKHNPIVEAPGPETLVPHRITISNNVSGEKRLGSLGADVINRGTFTIKGNAELTYVDREALAKLLRC